MRGAGAPALLLLLAGVGGVFTGRDGPMSSVSSLEEGSAALSCDTSLPSAGDALSLLVWYKSTARHEVAIYSYDSRVPAMWCRSEFNSSGRVTSASTREVPGSRLIITSISAEDQALYHCRVDFQLSPTRNSYVNLTVIILPRPPFVKNENGDTVNGTLRHYHEGYTLILTCYVIGGRPAPQIRWYSGETLLDATDGDSLTVNVRENELYLPLAREHAAAPLQCRASNTELARPLVFSLQVELYVPASSVQLVWESGVDANGALIAGRRAGVQCRAVGSYPQPEITWWLDQTQLTDRLDESWDASTLTVDSYLSLTPTRRLHGSTLSCVATNVLLAPANATRTATQALDVLYSPAVDVSKLAPGRQNETEEGKPLRLHCDVEANPAAHVVRWFFNNSDITSLAPMFASSEVKGFELRVMEAKRQHGGKYACEAGNTLGDARSEGLAVAVLYAPECLYSQVSLVGESVRCEVVSLPVPDTFLWRVRAGGELQNITNATPTLRLSLLQGSLDAPLQVWCEGTNTVGSQRLPCEATLSLKHLQPAPLKQCDMTFEMDAFHVHCQPGGNATYHILSVWRMSTSNSSLALAWRARSAFGDGRNSVGGDVGSLAAGDEVGVAACNNYGCSTDTLVRPSAALLQAAAPPWWRGFFEKDLGISIGIVLIVCAFVVSSLLMTRLVGRSWRTKPPPPVIQVLQLDDFTARDYIDVMERKSRSHKSCSSVYSGCSLDDCPPLVDRRTKPIVWRDCHATSRDCLPDLTSQLTRESAV